MTSDALKQLIQENSAEAAHVDFKQEWHRNKAKGAVRLMRTRIGLLAQL
jgi:hypothetical protein